MKALIIPVDNGHAIELIAESADERKQLRKLWAMQTFEYISSEEWREIHHANQEGQ